MKDSYWIRHINSGKLVVAQTIKQNETSFESLGLLNFEEEQTLSKEKLNELCLFKFIWNDA